MSNTEDHLCCRHRIYRGNWAYNNDMSKYLGKRQKDKPKPKPKELSNDQQSIINSLA